MVCNTQNHWACGLCPSSGIVFCSYIIFQTVEKVHKTSDSQGHEATQKIEINLY
jgi:hypothetical protein